MGGRNQNGKNAVRGKEVFVGIDVHKESWQVTLRTEGEEVFHGRIPAPVGDQVIAGFRIHCHTFL
jgi:hypothetical protein